MNLPTIHVHVSATITLRRLPLPSLGQQGADVICCTVSALSCWESIIAICQRLKSCAQLVTHLRFLHRYIASESRIRSTLRPAASERIGDHELYQEYAQARLGPLRLHSTKNAAPS